ncbi:MAG: MBL fold metallo-hydrolase [Euryarchaeota archaeon]|nr:MBL fold metallo-hydrolase [Euryarchaeota archaeon]
MEITILGTESLGVRGLSCVVKTGKRRVVIDPGVALGYNRHGLLPHPAQVAKGEEVRCKIIEELKKATDIVISHYHGDHIPLPDANPYQLKAQRVAPFWRDLRIWAKGPERISRNMLHRLRSLSEILSRDITNAEKTTEGPFAFSAPVPHGSPSTRLGTVMMTRISDQETVFVHASDIQLLNKRAIRKIVKWQPTVVLASGPPIYLPFISLEQKRKARKNAKKLAEEVDTVIIDHHLLRCKKGVSWLDSLPSNVVCAADFMDTPRCFLEAWRKRLYNEMPVPQGWHDAYARGDADTKGYRKYTKG